MREYIRKLVERVQRQCRGKYEVGILDGGTVTYPIEMPTVKISEEKGDTVSLVGNDSFLEEDCVLVVTVLVDERSGQDTARECMKEIGRRILAADDERWIERVALNGCEHDTDLGAYRISMTMGLRECGFCEEE